MADDKNSHGGRTTVKCYFLVVISFAIIAMVYYASTESRAIVVNQYSARYFVHNHLVNGAITGHSHSDSSITGHSHSKNGTTNNDGLNTSVELSNMPWLTNLTEYSKTCTPLNDVAYVFNRKTGSTTLVTILDRVGKQNNFPFQLTMMFHKGENYTGRLQMYHIHGENPSYVSLPVMGTRREDRTLVPSTGQTISFAANDSTHLKVLNKSPQTILVSIVRHPTSNFESAFNFFNLHKYVSKNPKVNKLKEFFKKPEYYRKKIRPSRDWSVARNGQAWHLGLDHKYHDQEHIVNEYFTRLANELDLVLVTEYYDHSLILLKRLMCWKMENILYIARRVRSNRTTLTEDLKSKIRKWNYVDFKLYHIFNQTLWRKIRQYGPEFDKDLRDFRQLRDAVSKDCNDFKILRKNTIKLLAKFDSIVTESKQFCKNLKSWFTVDLNIADGMHGLGAYTSMVHGVADPLGKFKTDKTGNGEQCVKVYYHKAKSAKDTKSLDIYISKMGSNTSDIKVQNKGNDTYVASYSTGKWENFQVTTQVKYSTDNYLIDAMSMNNGRC